MATDTTPTTGYGSGYDFEHLRMLNQATNQSFFLSGFSHLFNNPLNSIQLASKLLGNYTQDITTLFHELNEEPEQETRSFCESGLRTLGGMSNVIQGICDSTIKLNQLVSNLTELTGRGVIAESRDIDCNRLISICVSLAQHQIHSSTHNLSLTLETDLPVVPGNAHHISQVVLSLLMNALIFLPDRSCAVNLSTSYDQVTGTVRICVRDEGAGVSPESIPRLLEPFFSTSPEPVSIGLGLTVAHHIILTHGGLFDIDSSPGNGTTVRVALPLSCCLPGV